MSSSFFGAYLVVRSVSSTVGFVCFLIVEACFCLSLGAVLKSKMKQNVTFGLLHGFSPGWAVYPHSDVYFLNTVYCACLELQFYLGSLLLLIDYIFVSISLFSDWIPPILKDTNREYSFL